MSSVNQHIPDAIEIEQFTRLVTARLGVSPSSAVLEEFLAEVVGGSAACLEQLSRPESVAEWSGAPATQLLTHETYFFRNKGHWDALRHNVLPRLLRSLDASCTPLRIWSAGCASGEEPLSIAMSLLDSGWAHLLGSGRIVATDVSDASLATACAATYTAKSLQCTPESVANRYFEKRKEGWVVEPRVTELVQYQRLNLADSVAVKDFIANEGPFHIVFCRNVLIYFHEHLCRRVLAQFASALRPEGALFLGHAEFPQMWSDAFAPEHKCGTIVWRHRRDADSVSKGRTRAAGAGVAVPPKPPSNTRFTAGLPARQTGLSVKTIRKELQPTASQATVPETDSREPWPEIIHVMEHAKFGRNGEAVSEARQLVEDHQLVPETHYVLGLALEASGQSDCAIGTYRNVIFLDPDFAQAHWRLGLTLAATGQHQLAIPAMRWAVKLMPTEKDARIQQLSDVGRGELIQTMEHTLEWLLKLKA